jgi:nucleoside-diphosphate-sugar epimerase
VSPPAAGTPAVLVTGAAGFFGLAIVRTLAHAGFPVLATDRVETFLPRPGTPAELVRYVKRDLEYERLDDLVAAVHSVVYAAALTPPDEGASNTADRLLHVNLEAFVDVLAAVRRTPACRRVALVSSASVYDQSRAGTMIRESDAGAGSSLYSAAKLAAELVGARHAALFGRDFCAVRPTSLIGPGEIERPSRPNLTAFAQLVRAASAGVAVRLDRAEAREDLIAVDDAAEAVAALWTTSRWNGESFNLSAGITRSLTDVAAAVSAVAGLRLDPDSEVVVDGRQDLPAIVSNERITAVSGWRPRRSLQDVVAEVLAET